MKEWARFYRLNDKRFKNSLGTLLPDQIQLWITNENVEYKKILCSFITNNVKQVSLYLQHWNAQKF